VAGSNEPPESEESNSLALRLPTAAPLRAAFRFYTLVVVYRNHGYLKLLIYKNYKAHAQLSASKLVYIVETVSF
jgi:hypothetical protein